MAYAPIALTIPQYDGATFALWWLKAYIAGTTTPLSMATDSTGGTLLAKCQIDAEGFPITALSARFIPFIDGDYDLWCFPTVFDANNNITTDAKQFADNVNADPESGFTVANFATLAGVETLTNKTITSPAITGSTFSGTQTGFTGDIIGDVTGNADTVTTNANLTGEVTSVGNATTIDNIGGDDPTPRRILIETQTAATSANIEFSTGIDATYDLYEVEIIGLIPTNATGTSLGWYPSIDGGSTYPGGGITLTGLSTTGLSEVVAEGGLYGRYIIPDPSTAKTHHSVSVADQIYVQNNGTTNTAGTGGTIVLSSAALNAFKFQALVGNILSGTFRLYGIK